MVRVSHRGEAPRWMAEAAGCVWGGLLSSRVVHARTRVFLHVCGTRQGFGLRFLVVPVWDRKAATNGNRRLLKLFKRIIENKQLQRFLHLSDNLFRVPLSQICYKRFD